MNRIKIENILHSKKILLLSGVMISSGGLFAPQLVYADNNIAPQVISSKVTCELENQSNIANYEYKVIDDNYINSKIEKYKKDNPYIKDDAFNVWKTDFLNKYKPLKGGIVITGYKGDKTIVEVPSCINNKQVVSIGEEAFSDKNITSVKLPENIVLIERSAFLQNQISGELKLPNSLKYIDEFAFTNNKITSIKFNGEIKELGKASFADNEISGGITLPNTIDKLEAGVFSNNKITSFKLPENINEIEENLFYKNNISGDVNIPKNIKKIGSYAFSFNKIDNLKISNSVEYIGFGAFSNNNISNKLELPDSINKIEKKAFSDNKITSVVLPNSIERIEDGVFANNQIGSLPKVPSTVTYLSGFNGNPIGGELIIPSSVKTIGTSAFSKDKYSSAKITSVVLPEGLERISDYAFGFNKIASLPKLPSTLKHLSGFNDNNMFCSNGLNLPNSIETIGNRAFANSSVLFVNIPGSLKDIGQEAFYKAHIIGTLSIPKNLNQIGDGAFMDNRIFTVNMPNELNNDKDRIFGTDSFRTGGDLATSDMEFNLI